MEVSNMIESMTMFPNKTSESVDLARDPWEIKEEICETIEEFEKEKNENITDMTTGVTFKALISLLLFVFFGAILAAALSDSVTNVIEKSSIVVAHYLATHSDKFMMVFR